MTFWVLGINHRSGRVTQRGGFIGENSTHYLEINRHSLTNDWHLWRLLGHMTLRAARHILLDWNMVKVMDLWSMERGLYLKYINTPTQAIYKNSQNCLCIVFKYRVDFSMKSFV